MSAIASESARGLTPSRLAFRPFSVLENSPTLLALEDPRAGFLADEIADFTAGERGYRDAQTDDPDRIWMPVPSSDPTEAGVPSTFAGSSTAEFA
jgi:hypothetical protein